MSDGALSTFSDRVHDWLIACFGSKIAYDKKERLHRFLEEALELVQACGCTKAEAHELVDYVFNRPVGEPRQESGGVSLTHHALCIAHNIHLELSAEAELSRVWQNIEKIRAKQAAKPKNTPLPQVVKRHRCPCCDDTGTYGGVDGHMYDCNCKRQDW